MTTGFYRCLETFGLHVIFWRKATLEEMLKWAKDDRIAYFGSESSGGERPFS